MGLADPFSQYACIDPRNVPPEQAARVDPRQVRDLAAEAERAQPGIVERLGGFYAQNAALVKKLGGAALALIVANLATRGRQ
jgi:hypothetical protein